MCCTGKIDNNNNTKLNAYANIPSRFFCTERSAFIKKATGEFINKKVSWRITT